jgi:hypothetical protein
MCYKGCRPCVSGARLPQRRGACACRCQLDIEKSGRCGRQLGVDGKRDVSKMAGGASLPLRYRAGRKAEVPMGGPHQILDARIVRRACEESRRVCYARNPPHGVTPAGRGRPERSTDARRLFLAVLLDVCLHWLFSVPSGVNHMAPCCVSMVCSHCVFPGIVMLGSFAVVPGGMREML